MNFKPLKKRTKRSNTLKFAAAGEQLEPEKGDTYLFSPLLPNGMVRRQLVASVHTYIYVHQDGTWSLVGIDRSKELVTTG